MLKIRLRRMGSTHRPFYRVVVSDSRRSPSSKAVEEIGYYNPRVKTDLKIDLERLAYWQSKGAQASKTVQRLARRQELGPAEEPVKKEEPKAEATPVEEAKTAVAEAAEVVAEAATEVAEAVADAATDAAEAVADAATGDDKSDEEKS